MKNLDFDTFFREQLNDAQQQAVTHENGSLLVIAGAGSGKTRVITARIMHLMLKRNVHPKNILALTFTNKAADEMRERVAAYHDDYRSCFIGTFHAYCLQLLKRAGDLMPFSSFTIMDGDDQQHLLTQLIKQAHLEKRISAKGLAYQISNKKNNPQQIDSFVDPYVEQLYHLYEQEKKRNHSLDFDDLLLYALDLFQKYPIFKQHHHNSIHHILVDEYQDTNTTQHALLKHMSKHENTFAVDSLCAVGDEDQSIYSWRGATVANMVHFQRDFPQTTIIKIEQNYRSAQSILHAANTVIAHNKQRHPKKLWSTKEFSDRVRILHCMSNYQEGEAIVHAIKHAIATTKYKTIAILYRAHYQSRSLEEALMRHTIAYTIIGGIEFYERKEIKDMLAYVRLIINPFDRIALTRIINCPQRGLGDKFQEEFFAFWDQQPFATFMECAHDFIQQGFVTGIKQKAFAHFIDLFTTISSNDTPNKALQHFIDKTQYIAYLQNHFDGEEATAKIDNIKELLRSIKPNISLEQFLYEIALMQENKKDDAPAAHSILLMTLHAAKGLEFDVVILSGLEDGVLPNARSIADAQALEEERRLLYVGITRAKEYLLLTHTRYRYLFKEMNDQVPSRFLKELPQTIISTEAHQWHEHQFISFFAQWFGVKLNHSIRTFGSSYNKSRNHYID